MKQLICGTTAYATFSNDVERGRVSHAYLLHMNDAKNLRLSLKIFAMRFFATDERSVDGKRILNESLPDCRIYPEEGKKLTVEAVGALLEDCAMRPLERDKKLYIISGFEQAAALVQNKLLKTLEEPPEGVYFLLGATTLAPVLDTVLSRVKTLTVPPFSEEEIFNALERKGANALNANAAKSCGGIFGTAENMVGGGWFGEVVQAARDIGTTYKVGDVGEVAQKYGDTKYKSELLSQLEQFYYTALCDGVRGKVGKNSVNWRLPTLVYALESINKANADVKFNAYFQGLLYDLMLRIIEENDKWLKLQA